MVFEKLIGNLSKGRSELKSAKRQLKIQKALEKSQKTPEERELAVFLERERQKKILERLQPFRDMEKERIFKSEKSILGGENIFANQKSMFLDRGNIL